MARILIVDDAFIVRNNLKTILTKGGHTVVGEASSGEQAIKMYEKFKPDLVTMDITMPDMNGIDATREIISRYPGARIVMVSALSQKSMVLTALELGAKHYIVKPFTELNVTGTIQKVLDIDGFVEPNTTENQEDKTNFLFEEDNSMPKP